MKIETTGCIDCQLCVMDINYDSMRDPYFAYCNFFRKIGGGYIGSGQEEENCFENKPKTLKDCPLLKEEITIKLI